tara:strand:+ start:3243 stop:3623 length:381 start_codon:yes stop_codon:yes gene_type:complete
MSQLILHLIGDYLLQSDWMALNKTKCHKAALAHALTYSLPFLLLQPSLTAWLVIFVTHFFIDRYRLAKYVGLIRSRLAPKCRWPKWADCRETGYHKDTPDHLSTWLLIISDNTLHLTINFLALSFL